MLTRIKHYQVKGLADSCRVTADVVRHYTRIGLLNPTRDPNNGYKLYTDKDAARLHFIRRAKHLGYTLKEISLIICDSEKGESPCPRVRKIIQHRIEEIRVQQEEAYQLLKRMELAVTEWQSMPDGVPDGQVICRLIESYVHPVDTHESNT